MPTPTLVRPQLALGAGYLFIAPLGSTEPTNTVAGSVFTDTWPVAWILAGATAKGHMFNYEVKTSPVDAAEYYEPLQYETDGREGSVDFEILSLTATNMKASLNGGAIAVTGTGATTLNTYTPPDPGSEVRQMIGWESRDGTERLIVRQAFQSGKVAISRNKGGANKASIPVSYHLEIPSAGKIFSYLTAGTARA